MNNKILLMLFSAVAFVSCEDFLVRPPKDALSPDTYFKSETECQLFTNNFYTLFPGGGDIYYESSADNIIPMTLSNAVIGNRVVPATADTWKWEKLRDINFFLSRSFQCEDEKVRLEYEGLARFFRAYFYFEKVKRYGDVPWVEKPLDADSEELYKGRDDRKTVMAKVLEDIDFAIDNLPAAKNVYRVTKWTALALKSRIFLFEGTFRKYHQLGDWEECLQEAAKAAETFCNTSGYVIMSEGPSPYLNLFNSLTSDKTEIILSRAYSAALSLKHDANGRFTSSSMGRPGLSKDFVNTYLMSDGSRFTDKQGYDRMSFVDEMKNRDPRLAQTVRVPGYKRVGGTIALAPNMSATTTGYQIIKYVAAEKYDTYNSSEVDLPLFRTAEVYLNLAEAKAELGTLTQADLDKTVNKIRERVSMPSLNLEASNSTPDPYLMDKETGYSNVCDSEFTGVILEIRRERSIELVSEGFRYWDIMRWREGKRFERPFLGLYLDTKVGEHNIDGLGNADLVIYEGKEPSDKISGASYLSSSEVTLTNGTFGNIVCHGSTTRTWDETKDYLYPIPTEDIVLTGGAIKQNPGWVDGIDY